MILACRSPCAIRQFFRPLGLRGPFTCLDNARQHLHGESKTASVGSVSRIPVPDIEDTIVNALNESPVVQKEKSNSGITRPDRKVILEQVARIDVHEDRLAIRLKHSRRRRNS